MEVILTHEHADFDALASLLAAAKLFPGAVPVLPRHLNRNLRDFLVLYRGSLPFRRADELPKRAVAQAIFVDTQTAQSVRGMTADTQVRIIDHHSREQDLPEHYHYWGEAVGATTTLLLEQISGRDIAISPIEATLLLLGIYEDTGSLSYTSTTARDLHCAAWLLERGANLEVLKDFLHHPLTPAQLALLKLLTEDAQTFEVAAHTIVVAMAPAEEYVDEVSTLAHKMRELYDPDGLFLIVDLSDRIQFVARSTTNHIHVGDIAEAFGGGGHARAAAALIRGQSLVQVRERLTELLRIHVHPPVTVRQIMSWGLNALPPDLSVGEAAQRMRRLGHEGFPVVEKGKLLGLMTRRDLDRAMHHHMQQVPISRVMRAGQTTVRLDDSIDTLQKQMMEAGWGQVPVVDEQGEMVGIVTRTDLLKLWATPDENLSPTSVALKMEAALPDGLLSLLRDSGRASAELNYPLYSVGGFVRDLLLGRPNFDIDLVVEGEAAELAEKLAAEKGGRVRAHKRFGTAKWIRDNNAYDAGLALPDQTPSSLDFASARTEFYEEATALPVVESSSIKLDLHRRDFTINTLAVRLDNRHWGELLDFYGGQRDLDDGIIRVLHSLSFVEDPTRILRAARFEQRFGFQIEPRSAELIADAIDLLPRVSGARIRHELNLIFLEGKPEQALSRLHELGVLTRIDQALFWDDALAAKFPRLRAALRQLPTLPEAIERLYLGLWLYRLSPKAHTRLVNALRLNTRSSKLLEQSQHLRKITPGLSAPDLSASQLDQLLSPFTDAALLIARIDSDDWPLRERILDYSERLRPIEINLSGQTLKALGVHPGPIYRHILQTVRAARIDGEIKTEAEEITLAKRIIEQQATNNN